MLFIAESRNISEWSWGTNEYPMVGVGQRNSGYKSVYKMFNLCELVGGEALEAGLETTGAEFFGESELPPLSVERNTAEQLQRMFELARDHTAQTLLD